MKRSFALDTYKSIVLFLAKTVLFFLVFNYFFIAYTGCTIPDGRFYSSFLAENADMIGVFRRFLLWGGAKFAILIGYPSGYSDYTMFVLGGSTVRLVYSCMGFGLMAVYAALILAWPASWKNRIVSLIVGLVTVVLLNMIRIGGLAVLFSNGNRRLFSFVNHHDFFNIVVVVIIFLLFVVHVQRSNIGRQTGSQHATHDHENVKLHVKFFFRHRRPEYNSIEEVFDVTLSHLPANMTYERIVLRYTGAGIKAIIGNLIYAHRNRGGINHITGDVHYIALATGRNTVLTIHDTRSALTGSFVRRLFVKFLWFWLPALCVKKMTTISPASAQELRKIVPFAREKICVVPNPYNVKLSNGQVWARPLAGRASVLLIGTKANKNIERTIAALDPLMVKFVILGKLADEHVRSLDERKFEYASHFNVAYEKVVELYHNVDLLCFASLYEGFGVPILEAQAAGKPVVTSVIEPMKWVAGDGACFVDPLDVNSIREGVDRVLNDTTYRNELIRKGKENVLRFDPAVVADMYKKVYEETT